MSTVIVHVMLAKKRSHRHGVTGNKLALRVPNITIDTLTLERVETSSSRAAFSYDWEMWCEEWTVLVVRSCTHAQLPEIFAASENFAQV